MSMATRNKRRETEPDTELVLISTPEESGIIQKEDYVESSDELVAIQALNQLQNSSNNTPQAEQQSPLPQRHDETEPEDEDEFYDTTNDLDSLSSSSSNHSKLLNKVKNHPIVNSAVRAYKSNKPALQYGVEIVERAALPMVTMIEQTSSEWKRKRRLSKTKEMFPDELQNDLKRQKLPSISEALALGNKNLNELSLNMSIESKKRLTTCLQLLMLANKQLSSKISHLQELIVKEQELILAKKEGIEIFHDANEDPDYDANETKKEIIGTVKKVVSFISKHAGTSLPEPARSHVRETLLKLPLKWSTQTSDQNSTLLRYSKNGKVLVLANESLEMVGSVMSVFDETLAKAEVWVKQKQEKQLAKRAILNNSLRKHKDPVNFD